MSAKVWHIVMATVGIVAVIATCSFFSYRLVQEEQAGLDAQAQNGPPAPTVAARDISSREVDPEPLTIDEVFPGEEIIIDPQEPPYQILATDETADCAAAVADDAADLFTDRGCDQVIRATLRSPDEDYLVTAGIFNLATEQEAQEAFEEIKPFIEAGTGRFLGLLAGTGTEPIVLAETVLAWDFRGHFLMYAVVARSDGEALSDTDDRQAQLFFWDTIEVHLRGRVLERRATVPIDEVAGELTPSAAG